MALGRTGWIPFAASCAGMAARLSLPSGAGPSHAEAAAGTTRPDRLTRHRCSGGPTAGLRRSGDNRDVSRLGGGITHDSKLELITQHSRESRVLS